MGEPPHPRDVSSRVSLRHEPHTHPPHPDPTPSSKQTQELLSPLLGWPAGCGSGPAAGSPGRVRYCLCRARLWCPHDEGAGVGGWRCRAQAFGETRGTASWLPQAGAQVEGTGPPPSPFPSWDHPPPVRQERELSWPPARGTEGGGQKDEVTGTEGVTCLQSNTHSQRHRADTHAVLWTDSPARRGLGRWGLRRQPAGVSGQQGGDACHVRAAGCQGFSHVAQ